MKKYLVGIVTLFSLAIVPALVSAQSTEPTLTLSANPSTITAGQSTILSWSTTNESFCNADFIPNTTTWNVNSSQTLYNLNSTQTYTMTCFSQGGGGSITKSVTVTVLPSTAPTLVLTANPSTITAGQSTTVSWSTTNASYCNAPDLFSGSNWNINSSQVVNGLSSSQTYTMTCTGVGGGGSVTKSVTVTVMPSTAPTLILAASPDTITAGQSATIAWYTTNATYCNAPDLIPNTTTWNVNSSQTFYPNSTRTYTMTCVGVGGGGSVTKSITITVVPSTSPTSPQLFGFSFPTSGANLVQGSTYRIIWFNDNSGGYGYTAYIGTGVASNGSNLETIIRTIGAVNSNAQNEFSWTVPSDLSPRSDYRFEFRGKGGGGGVSPAFSVTALTATTPTPTPQPSPTPLPADVDTQNPQGACLDLQNNLRYRMRDTGTSDDISSLQDFLQANGYLHTEPTGFFGVLTLQAAKNFQQANGISPTGFVGPITRAKIKALSCQ